MAAYHEHIMIPTGRVDWTSRIEEDPGLPFVKHLKDALGQKGKYSNVRRTSPTFPFLLVPPESRG